MHSSFKLQFFSVTVSLCSVDTTFIALGNLLSCQSSYSHHLRVMLLLAGSHEPSVSNTEHLSASSALGHMYEMTEEEIDSALSANMPKECSPGNAGDIELDLQLDNNFDLFAELNVNGEYETEGMFMAANLACEYIFTLNVFRVRPHDMCCCLCCY